MYSKQELAQTKKRFWTSFGQYMRPVRGAHSDTINWLNYKTGARHIYFRMDVLSNTASVAIELQHPDPQQRHIHFDQMLRLRPVLEEATGEHWDWDRYFKDEHENELSRIGTTINDVNIFNESDWPLIISFLKPRIIALDRFWHDVKDGFE
jgi:hypothetical protein